MRHDKTLTTTLTSFISGSTPFPHSLATTFSVASSFPKMIHSSLPLSIHVATPVSTSIVAISTLTTCAVVPLSANVTGRTARGSKSSLTADAAENRTLPLASGPLTCPTFKNASSSPSRTYQHATVLGLPASGAWSRDPATDSANAIALAAAADAHPADSLPVHE